MTDLEIGVIGGVGPAATAEFLSRVVQWTQAATDQDHANLVVLQHSAIPDRTDFLLGHSEEDPGPVLAADARRLRDWGVEAIVVPCNTATAFMRAMSEAVSIPVIDIIDAAAEDAKARGWSSVGVLATEGTMASGAYARALDHHGVTAIAPSPEAQAAITTLIYRDIKAGRPPERVLFDRGVEDVRRQGAEGVILGCTELSVAAATWQSDPLVLDALDSLAIRTVRLAGCAVRTR